jgi:hypothetical protein
MRIATGLAVVAVGAILAFAVNGHPSFLNIQVTGWVIMLTGIAGIVVPRRGYGWMRRQLRWQAVPRRRNPASRFPQYAALSPGAQPPPDGYVTADAWGSAGPRPVSDDTDPLISEVRSTTEASVTYEDPVISEEVTQEVRDQ